MASPITTDSPGVAAPLWEVVMQAFKGEQHDYTAVSLNRAVVLLAVPMVFEMIMESLFAVVDVFWVSRLGRDAVAVIGLTEAVMTFIYAVAIGISLAATAIVARRIGEKDPESAAQAAGQIITLGLGISVGLGLVLGYFSAEILSLMGADATIVALGSDFARIMLGGNVTVFMIFLINAIFRGAGDAVLAMRTLCLANALNIVLGPFFIFGWGPAPELGVTGAAVATNIGRGVGLLYQLWSLAEQRSRVQVRMRHLQPLPRVLTKILTAAASGIAQLLISMTGWIGLFKIVAMFGSAALAGYTIAVRIITFALLPAWGLAGAGATLVGQSLGASNIERARAAVRTAMRFNVWALTVVGAIFIAFSERLVGFFSTDPEVLNYGSQALWVVSLSFPIYAAGMCFIAAFNGAGDTWTPTRLNFFCFWLGQIPLAWLLARGFELGPTGVFVAVPISFAAITIWSAVLFAQGKWNLR